MPCLKTVLLILSCISLDMCNEQRAAWKIHNRLISTTCSPCKVPQPRVFYIEELMDERDWIEKYEAVKKRIKPPMTVLHRCEFAGCCKMWNQDLEWDLRCMYTNREIVNLTFFVQPDQSIYQQKQKLEYFTIPQINHTECACQKIANTEIK